VTTDYRGQRDTSGIRVLFCIGILQRFFDADDEGRPEVVEAFIAAFRDLDRFGIRVLGTFDDDNIMVGASPQWPWTAYILAQAPDLDAVAAVCDLIRQAKVGRHRLWRFMRIEARIGNPLFGGIEPAELVA
jgi:hypothetical protein